MTTNPALSFIVPTRNAEEILEFTLSNLLDSKDQRYEVVVNLNNSEGYVQEYITKFNDNRLKIYCAPPNVTMSKNWFQGLQNSIGKWICFVGSDDGVVSKNITKFIDLLTQLDEESIVTNHDVAFHYARDDKSAWINRPNSRPTGKMLRIKWPIKSAAFFPQFFYDLPMPYSKAIVKRDIFEFLLCHDTEIPGAAPDVFLGNYLALNSKTGIFYDEILTIRGNSRLSIGSQVNNRNLGNSAQEIVRDLYAKGGSSSMVSVFGPTCRPALSLDFYVQSKSYFTKKNIKYPKYSKIWCNLTCMDKSHHDLYWHKFSNVSYIFYFFGLLRRKVWHLKNFGCRIPKDSKELVSSFHNIFTISKVFYDRYL